jgi:hypothetical protein
VRIAPADPLDGQMVQHTGSLGLEGPAQPCLVFLDREVSLAKCLSEKGGGAFALRVCLCGPTACW